MKKIGIMQGRLTPSKGRGIQFFPFDEWEKEFLIGAEIGLSEIEWVFDYENYKDNPIFFSGGCKRIIKAMQLSGVCVNSVCWDYFMRRPFYKSLENMDIINENKEIFMRVVEGMNFIGATLIEIPLVDNSSLSSQVERNASIEFLRWCASYADKYSIKVGIESDLEPGVFRTFLNDISKNNIVANYDSGNSSGLGYNHMEELLSLGDYVFNVHIKDRKLYDGTMPLGTGDADFEQVFAALKKIKYDGSFILQAARPEDGNEKKCIANQKEFVESYLKKYDL